MLEALTRNLISGVPKLTPQLVDTAAMAIRCIIHWCNILDHPVATSQLEVPQQAKNHNEGSHGVGPSVAICAAAKQVVGIIPSVTITSFNFYIFVALQSIS